MQVDLSEAQVSVLLMLLANSLDDKENDTPDAEVELGILTALAVARANEQVRRSI